jgi:spore coat protein CotF
LKIEVNYLSLPLLGQQKNNMAADIPLKKIENPSFRAFLEKYCNQHIPHDTTVRKTYVDVIYEETMSKIRDETTDVD